MGRLTIRVWILGIALILSLVSIISGSGSVKLMVLALGIGTLFGANSIKSKIGASLAVLILLITMLFLILNSVETGVVVTSIEQNSSIMEAGLKQGEIIQSVNGKIVSDKESYSKIIGELFSDGNEKRVDIKTKDNEYTALLKEPPKITVGEIPKTGLKTGLDLRGGARALVEPEGEITDSELEDLVEVSRNRFNVFGLSDIKINGVNDLEGNKFMLIEIAGATPNDLDELISKQGKFEAKIGNESVFVGGNRDVSDVCRNDATCAGVTGCFAAEGGFACNFQFTIYLTEETAKRHAAITDKVPLDGTGQYLTERLNLFVDDSLVDSLLISSGLKGQITTQISIQGSGQGATQDDALADARDSMKKLQTIMITGSLPYKLSIVKLDTISPTLGKDFIRLILLGGAGAIVGVSVIIFARYRKFKASLALLVTAISEVLIILGVASFIGWNLDLPSIAGILATIGTGVDQQIVILDESERNRNLSIKERMKRALFVIMTAYATMFASLIPLYWAGAGLFKGFALTTIIGITAGVLLTRPAFADMVKRMES
jgi:preprotein translocase subunit SecD